MFSLSLHTAPMNIIQQSDNCTVQLLKYISTAESGKSTAYILHCINIKYCRKVNLYITARPLYYNSTCLASPCTMKNKLLYSIWQQVGRAVQSV